MAFPTSNLSGENVLRDIHDPVTQTIRTSATAIIAPGLQVEIDHFTDSIRLGDGTSFLTSTQLSGKNGLDVNLIDKQIEIKNGSNILAVNADGSINASVIIDHTEDSIRLGDGSVYFTSTTTGPKTGLDVNLMNANLPLPLGAATETTLVSVLTELQQKTEPSDAQNIRVISSITDSITVPGISSIDSKIPTQGQKVSAQSIPVVFASDQSPLSVNLGNEPFKVSGTKDGLAGGTEYTFVNNERQQVLNAHDRIDTYTYADFGTKTQRITRVDYTSATFPGITIRRDFNYVLDGNKYRRTNSPWVIV